VVGLLIPSDNDRPEGTALSCCRDDFWFFCGRTNGQGRGRTTGHLPVFCQQFSTASALWLPK